MKTYEEIVKPTLVLVIIASVIAALLALTYNLAGVAAVANAGYTNEEIAAFAMEALPGADNLSQVEYTPGEDDEDIQYIYTASNGTGAAIILNSKGYSSDGIIMMVGINADGTAAGVKVIKHGETPGIGDKVCADTAYQAGVVEKLNSGGEPDVVAGASKSSNGIIKGVRRAVEFYETLQKEGVLK